MGFMTASRVTLNGKSGDASVVQEWVGALNDPRIVREKAGFLFKVLLDGDHLMLAATPCLINGERLHHYDQELGIDSAYTLLGDVNASGIFTILFKPENRNLSDEQKTRYLKTFRQFAKLLLAQGYTGEGILSDVTRTVLQEIGTSPAPRVLADFRP
jgi:hypothetical protein